MYLKRLKIVNFKNFGAFEAEFSPKINSLTGPNGTGKTNILDAVYYLCFTKSYFASTDVQNIRHGENFMMLEGVFSDENGDRQVLMSLQRGAKKTVKRDGKQVERMGEYIGAYPLVIVSPADRDLIADGSSLRRKFIDGVVSQTSSQHLDAVVSHARIIELRNALLKTPSVTSLQIDVYDKAMIELGRKIYEGRQSFLERFVPVFKKTYSDISGGGEQADITYTSIFENPDAGEILHAARARDLMVGFSTTGAHKDDLKFTLDGYPVKNYGSQGQQKTFLTALKLAQFHFITSLTGRKPILLLDDIFDKLDSRRVEYIMSLVNGDTFGQIFVSDTQPERIRELMRAQGEGHSIFTL